MLGPANESALARPSHVFPTPGTYVVTLAVTDDEGSTATRYARITVQ